MAKKEWIFIIVTVSALFLLFFHQTVFRGKVPFPGDILVSDFQPWRSTSYLGYGAGGIPNKAQYPDTIRQMYPWKTAVVSALKQGKLPLWNPYNFSGSPLLANFQSSALYPLGVFYLILPQITAWTILVILQPLLAFLFTYFFARKLGMGKLASTLSAISYGFSGFMSVWLEYNTISHVVLWLPLMLLSIEHLRNNPHRVWLAVLIASHTMSLFAGHPQVYAYLSAYALLYGLFRMSRSMWSYLIGSTLLGIGITGIQLIPGIELISLAARSPHDPGNLFAKILIHPGQLLALPFPNIFGNPATRTYWPTDTFIGKVTTIGLVPLFFFLSTLRRKDTVSKWFVLASIAVVILITSNPITQILYRVPIPLFTSSSPTLMSFLLAFSLAISCGLGLDYWITDKHSVKKLIRRTVEMAGVFLLLFIATRIPVVPELSLHTAQSVKAILYGVGITAVTLALFWVAIKFPRFRMQAVTVMVIVHALDMFVFFHRFNPFVPYALVFPEHKILTYLKEKAPDRYWGYGTAGIPANFATHYGLYSPEGYDPLYPKRYGEFLYAYRTGKLMDIFDNASRSDAAISSQFGDGGLTDTVKQKLISAISVRYILDRTENASSERTFPPEIIKKIASIDDWVIYENSAALPRAFVAGKITTLPPSDDFADTFFSDSHNMHTTALVPGSTRQTTGIDASGSATILAYEPERVTIRTESTVSGLLVLTDTFFAGWRAEVDGTPTTVVPANWTMRGVTVPAGTHTVTMTYMPSSVKLGILLSMTSLFATILIVTFAKQKQS
jgi:hypothetical protein